MSCAQSAVTSSPRHSGWHSGVASRGSDGPVSRPCARSPQRPLACASLRRQLLTYAALLLQDGREPAGKRGAFWRLSGCGWPWGTERGFSGHSGCGGCCTVPPEWPRPDPHVADGMTSPDMPPCHGHKNVPRDARLNPYNFCVASSSTRDWSPVERTLSLWVHCVCSLFCSQAQHHRDPL